MYFARRSGRQDWKIIQSDPCGAHSAAGIKWAFHCRARARILQEGPYHNRYAGQEAKTRRCGIFAELAGSMRSAALLESDRFIGHLRAMLKFQKGPVGRDGFCGRRRYRAASEVHKKHKGPPSLDSPLHRFGQPGVEPGTPSPPDLYANHLRYCPKPLAKRIDTSTEGGDGSRTATFPGRAGALGPLVRAALGLNHYKRINWAERLRRAAPGRLSPAVRRCTMGACRTVRVRSPPTGRLRPA